MEISGEFKKRYALMEGAYDAYRREISVIPTDYPEKENSLLQKVKESDPVCRAPMYKLGELTIEFTASQRDAHHR